MGISRGDYAVRESHLEPAERPGRPGRRRHRAVLVVLVAGVMACVGAAHRRALSARALCFDDNQYLLDNVLVRNPSWASAGRFAGEVTAPSTVRGYYQPLALISLMCYWISSSIW